MRDSFSWLKWIFWARSVTYFLCWIGLTSNTSRPTRNMGLAFRCSTNATSSTTGPRLAFTRTASCLTTCTITLAIVQIVKIKTIRVKWDFKSSKKRTFFMRASLSLLMRWYVVLSRTGCKLICKVTEIVKDTDNQLEGDQFLFFDSQISTIFYHNWGLWEQCKARGSYHIGFRQDLLGTGCSLPVYSGLALSLQKLTVGCLEQAILFVSRLFYRGE